MKTITKDEKRKHPRFPVGITMEISAKGAPTGRCRGTIADLSVSGMTLKTDAVLEEGMCVHLKLGFPLEIRGEVRHIKGSAPGGLHRYGVRFHKIGRPAGAGPLSKDSIRAAVGKN